MAAIFDGSPDQKFYFKLGALKENCKGMSLDFQKFMESTRQQLTYREALTKAMDICGRSEKCRYDIELKCREWQLSKEETVQLTNTLLKEKFIDQQRYANSFVNDKFKFNKWGKIKLAYALRQKKLEEKMIREALTHIPENTYREVLSDLLSAKAKTIRENDAYTRRSKLMAFAQSRGFEADTAMKVVDRL
ncbi:MAG: regulatory protein RecX [Prolixibacteraceae bacterium]